MKRKTTVPVRSGPGTTGHIARSFHGPTALAAVALYLHGNGSSMKPEALILEAAHLLRVPGAENFGSGDPTYSAALKAFDKMLAAENMAGDL